MGLGNDFSGSGVAHQLDGKDEDEDDAMNGTIVHLLSQRPDATGSGISLQAMLRGAQADGYRNCLVVGVDGQPLPTLPGVAAEQCRGVRFGEDIDLVIPGMSDVMPYASSRFSTLAPDQVQRYEEVFATVVLQAVQRWQPDLVHSHHLWLLTAQARRLVPALPLVVTCHGSDLRQYRLCPHLRERVRPACQEVDRVLALSQAQAAEIHELYGIAADRIRVVGAGFDRSLFQAGHKAESPPLRLLYAGKLSRAKGVPYLLAALAAVSYPSWQLDLVGGGSGAEQEEILGLAQIMGNRVRVHGPLSQARLAALMARAHLFVLPSLFEGLPLVLLEALASGCRLVCTDLPGVRELCGGLDDPGIQLVATPRLCAVDQVEPSAVSDFIGRLRQGLQGQMMATLGSPNRDLSPVEPVLERYAWSGVYARVRSIYRELWP